MTSISESPANPADAPGAPSEKSNDLPSHENPPGFQISPDVPKRNFFLLGISGGSASAGCGKDFVVRNLLIPMLCPNRRYAVLSFADHFKFEMIVTDNLSREKVFGRKDERTRRSLQKRGTEEGRDRHGQDIWIKILNERLIEYANRGIEYFFITDCRFPNEIEFVKHHRGRLVHIDAPDRHLAAMREESETSSESGSSVPAAGHRSETSLAEFKDWDYTIDNTIENAPFVADQVRKMVIDLRENWFCYPQTIFCDLDDTIVKCYEAYRTVEREIKALLVERLGIHSHDFDTHLAIFNQIRMGDPFVRENFAVMFTRLTTDVLYPMAKKKIEPKELMCLIHEIFGKAMKVYDADFPIISEKTREWIQTTHKRTHLVILTLGDPVDQVRKLYKAGLFGLNVECVLNKNKFSFTEMMDKYPSQEYVMIGDSMTRDMFPAQEVAMTKIFWVTKDHPLESIAFLN